MYGCCQAGAHRTHSVACLLAFALLAAGVAVRRGPLALEAHDGEAFAALRTPNASLLHRFLLRRPLVTRL